MISSVELTLRRLLSLQVNNIYTYKKVTPHLVQSVFEAPSLKFQPMNSLRKFSPPLLIADFNLTFGAEEINRAFLDDCFTLLQDSEYSRAAIENNHQIYIPLNHMNFLFTPHTLN